MRNWMIKRLGGVTKRRFDRLLAIYHEDVAKWQECVELHKMQGAWEELKRKGMRAH